MRLTKSQIEHKQEILAQFERWLKDWPDFSFCKPEDIADEVEVLRQEIRTGEWRGE